MTAEVVKNNIFAVFTDRSEKEIVCTPSRILKVEISETALNMTTDQSQSTPRSRKTKLMVNDE